MAKAAKKRARKRAPAARHAASGDRAADVIAFIEKFLRVPDGKFVGQPVRLREWQQLLLRELYGTPTRQAIWSMGRKNGKMISNPIRDSRSH